MNMYLEFQCESTEIKPWSLIFHFMYVPRVKPTGQVQALVDHVGSGFLCPVPNCSIAEPGPEIGIFNRVLPLLGSSQAPN